MVYIIIGGSEQWVNRAEQYRKLYGGASERDIVIKSGADRLLGKTLRKNVISGILAVSMAHKDSYVMPVVDFSIKGSAEDAEYEYAQQAADIEEYIEFRPPVSYGIFE